MRWEYLDWYKKLIVKTQCSHCVFYSSLLLRHLLCYSLLLFLLFGFFSEILSTNWCQKGCCHSGPGSQLSAIFFTILAMSHSLWQQKSHIHVMFVLASKKIELECPDWLGFEANCNCKPEQPGLAISINSEFTTWSTLSLNFLEAHFFKKRNLWEALKDT